MGAKQAVRTCRAARPLLLVSLPCLSNSSIVPIGASGAVAVKIVTEFDRAHSDERASPLKPKVLTDVKSANVVNFDVWCFNAVITPVRDTPLNIQ